MRALSLSLALLTVLWVASGPAFAADKPRGPGTDCVIKGNISYKTGEKIYHVPGQRYYGKTKISEGHGERWFCTEAEARKAGWRKAKV